MNSPKPKLAPATMIVVDSDANLTQFNQLGCELNLSINLLIDIDAGIGRTGASFETAFDLALAVHQHSNTVLKGIQCYAGHFQPAMTLLTSVISVISANHAGTKALYKEATHPQIISHDELKYEWHYFGDEHGKVSGDNLPNVGDMIEMIVPHCDPTINLHDKFYVLENDIVVNVWDIALRGKLA